MRMAAQEETYCDFDEYPSEIMSYGKGKPWKYTPSTGNLHYKRGTVVTRHVAQKQQWLRDNFLKNTMRMEFMSCTKTSFWLFIIP